MSNSYDFIKEHFQNDRLKYTSNGFLHFELSPYGKTFFLYPTELENVKETLLSIPKHIALFLTAEQIYDIVRKCRNKKS